MLGETAPSVVSQNGPWLRISVAKRPTLFSRSVSFLFVFALHRRVHSGTTDWESWLTQADVDGMVAAKLNTVRVPLGFWVIEDIVDKSHEPYAEGGLDELVCVFLPLWLLPLNYLSVQIRGLTMFRDSG